MIKALRYSNVRLAYAFVCRGLCRVNFSAKRFVHVTCTVLDTELISLNTQLLLRMFGLIEVGVRTGADVSTFITTGTTGTAKVNYYM